MVAHGIRTGFTLTDLAREGVLVADAGSLRQEAEAGLTLVAQALPGMDLTQLQRALVLRVLEYEVMRLEEGWIDEWLQDMAPQLTGSP